MGKISKFDGAVLAVTALFLLGTGAWCWQDRAGTQPWSVEVSQRESLPPAVEESEPPSKLLEGETINVNTASAEELQRLPGIGEKRARDIVEWREAQGPFGAPEDLMQVPGIGEGVLAGCREYIRVEG